MMLRGGVDWPCMGKPFVKESLSCFFLFEIKVYIESLSLEDYHIILKSICPDIPSDVLRPMILFNEKVHIIIASILILCVAVQVSKICSRISSCIWEFNLRDIMRWCELMSKEKVL